jgi:hypothetical protein
MWQQLIGASQRQLRNVMDWIALLTMYSTVGVVGNKTLDLPL